MKTSGGRGAMGVVGLTVILMAGCGRTKPLEGRARALPHRCQCEGTICFLVDQRHIGRTTVCLADGSTRLVRQDEFETIVCSDARCGGGGFCVAENSAEVSCVGLEKSGSGLADPTELAVLNTTCDEDCGHRGRREFILFADGREFVVDSRCFGGGAVPLTDVVCGPAPSSDPPPIPGFSPAFTTEAEISPPFSSAEIQFTDEHGTLIESDFAPLMGGAVHIVPTTCASGTCPVTAWVGIGLGPFSARGSLVANAGLVSAGPLQGQLDSSGLLSFPSSRFIVSGVAGQDSIAADFVNALPITARLNEASGTLQMEVGVADATTQLHASVTARYARTPPKPVISGPSLVECTSPRGAMVELTAQASTDREGVSDLREFYWYSSDVDLDVPRMIGPAFNGDLPLGDQLVTLRAVDAASKEANVQHAVSVVDTRGPIFTSVAVVPPCVWPPSHDFALFELGPHLIADLFDACSVRQAVRVRIANVVSNEAADASGAGNTSPDVIFGTGALCVRAERAGGGAGRSYEVTLEALDEAENATQFVFTIVVPHDQRAGQRCSETKPEDRFVDLTDPRCTQAAAQPAAVVTEPKPQIREASPPDGCSSSGCGPALVLLLLLAVRTSTSSRRRLAVASLLAGGACAPLQAVPQCVRGWWLGPVSSCSIACASAGPPECSASDCEVRAFLAFFEDHSTLEGSITHSAGTKQLSGWGPRTEGAWQLVGSEIEMKNHRFTVTCDSSRLTLDGQLQRRAGTDMTTALDAARAAGGWIGVGY